MNNRGQFSIIAALFVAVILIATVIITYSTIRNSNVQDQPPLLSAVDETNLAVKQILGFTVGYYGSVLQVTGNYSYARDLALAYLESGLVNIANMHPQWGTSLNVTESDLQTYWFTNSSYSAGSLAVEYNLAGLGIRGLTYETSCRLNIDIVDSRDSQAFLSITKDEGEPLINLGKQNFKFYYYDAAESKWTLISPSSEPIAYANGTYQIDIPSGVDPYSYLVQTEDPRGIMVVTSTFSHYTITPSWNSTSVEGDNFVDNNISDVDTSPDSGTHSNFPAQQAFDNNFDILTEARVEFLVKKGTFTKATTTGSQIITGVGFQPKALIFSWTRQTSYGETGGLSVGYGFATGYGGSYQNGGAAFASDDGAGSSNTGRRRSNTYCIIILSNGNPTMSAQARVTGFNSDGFTLEWQTNEARLDIIHYVALGGQDLTDAKAGSFSLSTSGGSQDITSVGFQPTFAMFLWTSSESADTSTTDAEIGLGFVASSSQRAAIVAVSEDGRPTMDTWEQQRTDSCILLLDPTDGSQDAVVDFSQFLANGFRLSKSDPPGSSTSILYLALRGGYYKVGSFDSPTSTGTQDVTGMGFEPKLLMLTTQGRQASSSIGATAEIAFGTGASLTDRGSTWFEDTDNLADSDNDRETLNNKIIQWRDQTSSNTFSLRGSADLSSFLADGFRLSWSTVEAAAKQVLYVAFGGQNNYQLDLEVQWLNANFNGTTETLAIYSNVGAGESLQVDVWYSGSWQNVIPALTSGWNNASVASYLDSSTFTIRFKGTSEIADQIQNSWSIDATLLHVWPVQDIYGYMENATIVTEVLQNGTIQWLGQGLQMATAAKPIPPIPVRALRVNQTVNGVSNEVPFQVEDWASEYRIPLGLTNNASVFSGRNMLVFLMTPKVTGITIWWSSNDRANQTSRAFENRYFRDNPSAGTLTNGKLTLQFGGSFTVTASVGSVTSTANFMRINSENSVYGADPAYVIYNGTVRDVVHQEAEWDGGAVNCPNLYAHIVLTLPANATYYTYQLRLMFVQSQQSRNIADLCPIRFTTSTGTPQTENGTLAGVPIVSTASATFYNYSASTWMHHWSQMISGTSGAGIYLRNEPNEKLYVFDSLAGNKTGGIAVNGGTRTIELLPVTRFPMQFTSAMDVSWCGAVATFDSTCLPIYGSVSGATAGLWILAEYPPAITVTMTS